MYVNRAFSGTELGTAANPFKTVSKSVFAVRKGGNIYIEQGSYPERMILDKAMTLHSRNGAAVIAL
jgi:nitrous oxidase accessory protein NosD